MILKYQNEEVPTSRSRAIAEAKLAGKKTYYYNGEELDFPPTSFPYPDEFGVNPGEDLSYENLDEISAGEVMPQTRDEAFAAARRERIAEGGEGNFTWGGKQYHSYTEEDFEKEASRRDKIGDITEKLGAELVSEDDIQLLKGNNEFQGILRGRNRNKEERIKKRAGRYSDRQENKAERNSKKAVRQWKRDNRNKY